MKTSTTGKGGGGGRETTTQTNTREKYRRRKGVNKKWSSLDDSCARQSFLDMSIFYPQPKIDFNFFSFLLFLFWLYFWGGRIEKKSRKRTCRNDKKILEGVAI
jgi:hypothetical protein